ncbi:hypothetical protein HBB16_02615 [Pseudonocardia sp. MCCB 268]|nr:hypothetical protein [Pseudonocardia cytotoxica]
MIRPSGGSPPRSPNGPTSTRAIHYRYAVWHLRWLRWRVGDADTTYGQAVGHPTPVTAATTLLDRLTARTLTLATATQSDIVTWLASTDSSPPRSRRLRTLGPPRKLTRPRRRRHRWTVRTQALDTEARWDHARRLLRRRHTHTRRPRRRVALSCCSTPSGSPRSPGSPR